MAFMMANANGTTMQIRSATLTTPGISIARRISAKSIIMRMSIVACLDRKLIEFERSDIPPADCREFRHRLWGVIGGWDAGRKSENYESRSHDLGHLSV